ncbi:MAG: archease [Anaerolineae bacterium]
MVLKRLDKFEELEHTADRAIRAYGRTLEELFANAAFGMFSLMVDLEELVPTLSRKLRVEAFDLESLLVNWLNELLYLQEMEGEIYSEFHIIFLSHAELEATISGAKARPRKAKVKAATFYDLAIEKTLEGYVATVVFDV